MKRALAVATLLLAACANERPADSGIEGTVTLGPTVPVEREGEPRPYRPFATELVVVKQGTDDVAARGRSGADGKFRIALEPGAYTITGSKTAGPFPFLKPVDVTVAPHRFTTLEISFDTGIR